MREQVCAGKGGGFARSVAQKARHAAARRYQQSMCDMRALGAAPKTLASYFEEKYNKSYISELLEGYRIAYDLKRIPVLAGFAWYVEVAHQIEEQLVGITTSTGITIESFATHFIDRIIGQTSTPHKGMRSGVPIPDVLDALVNTVRVTKIQYMEDGDVRQKLIGRKAMVTISIRDKRLVQANQGGEKS